MSYRDTVFLPKTDFPLFAEREKTEAKILKFWEEINLFERLRAASTNRPKFTLHSGPPYANGNIHMGHAVNGVLKDILNKTSQMMGFDAALIPGWDCHGLPIEWQVESSYRAHKKDKSAVPVSEFMASCRAFAAHWVDIQREEFKRLGIVANWNKPYLTMSASFEATVAKQLLDLMMGGYLYQGLKPTLWSVVEETALAEAEVEYNDDHESDSIYVSFDINYGEFAGTSVVIWTTTPWTLPANRAIAYNKDFKYVLVEIDQRKFWLAKDCLEEFLAVLGSQDYSVLKVVDGDFFKGLKCAHPLNGEGYDFDVPLLPSRHVSFDVGTGFVHTAPSHGIEDFELAKEFNLEVPEIVLGNGRYDQKVPLFAGEHIYKVAPKILSALEVCSSLIHALKIKHSYPYSWRSKTPLIYRATKQWFVNIDSSKLKQRALAEIEKVRWHPKTAKTRIKSMVESRSEWCLSRQRVWGVPLPFYINKETGVVLKDHKLNESIVAKIAKEGIEAWRTTDFLQGLPESEIYEKVLDTADVWFDSGCTHHLLEDSADVYLEGSDQHRGWFQSSLLISAAAKGRAPYKAVITHGFILDENGKKMSKSLGNVTSPQEIVKKKGADLLRLYVANLDYTNDICFSDSSLKQQEDVYKRFRNTFRYLLGSIENSEDVPYSNLPELEKYILFKLFELSKLCRAAVHTYNFAEVYSNLYNFCANDLSAFYFDIRKDSLYCDKKEAPKRQACQYVLKTVFEFLVRALSPVLSFTCEEAWSEYQKTRGNPEQLSSIHEELFLEYPKDWGEFDSPKFDKIRSIRKTITCTLEEARTQKLIKSSQQACITLYVLEHDMEFFKSIDWSEICITSDTKIIEGQMSEASTQIEATPGCGVFIELARGIKCERCWKILEEVTDNLCQRCLSCVK